MGVAMRVPSELRVLGIAAAALALMGPLGAPRAQAPSPTIAYESAQYRYAVSLPAGCRQDEGPGTIDAVCAADLDAERSASAPVAVSLVLEVAAERVREDTGAQPASATPTYAVLDFRDELPEAICGTSDKNKVKIENVQEAGEYGNLVFTALVSCPETKFMGYPERKASVRYVITRDVRYRVFARAPADQFEQSKGVIDSFLASFRVLPQSN